MMPSAPCMPNPVCRPAPVHRRGQRSLAERVSDWFADNVSRPLCTWRARERLLAEMSQLDYRELKDMKLCKSDIPSFVAAWEPGAGRMR